MEELVRRLKNGEKEAFEDIVALLKHNLFIIAIATVKDEYIANEAIQETFIALYLNIKKIKNAEKIECWAASVLVNNCKRLIKKYNKNIISFEDIKIETTFSNNEYDKINDYLDFLKIIEFLNSEERTLMTMYYMDDYTTKDIAKILKMNENNVRSKIKRAREKIKLEKGDENSAK
ncbi:MAG: sigma-70 family RNA polymerase sigma factor [Clostridia bacterium]|nr:sigma-70 family RNA polymerase sigma factor [Clostridia bacterium]